MHRLCALLAATGWAIASVFPPSAVAGGVERVAVPMADGTRLNTDVYYPVDAPEPYPALLIRTPYGIDEGGVQALTQYGFAVVFQDVRGRFGSEGEFNMFRDDGWGPQNSDGVDTVTWILEQPWCSGSIVTTGSEAIGLTQNLLAAASPPALRAQVIASAPTALSRDFVYPGGALRFGDVSGFLSRLNASAYLDTLIAHPPRDPWWQWSDADRRLGVTSVPTYRISGWYDPNLDGVLRAYGALQGNGADQKLIIGPWTSNIGDPVVGERTFRDGSLAASEALVGGSWEWLLAYGRGISSNILDKPEVAFYIMGPDDDATVGNRWRTASSWPPASAEHAFYLREDGRLSDAPSMSTKGARSFVYDPLDPVTTVGGANLVGASGPWDQREVESRRDVLTFTTDPFVETMTIAGPVTATLFVSSDAPDTDFTAKLTDVHPDGRSMLLCDGIVRVGHWLDHSLSDSGVTALTISLGTTAVAIGPGHRLRLSVSSSNYPRFHPNPNTGEPFERTSTPRAATNRIHVAADAPSALIVPVLAGRVETESAARHHIVPPPPTIHVVRDVVDRSIRVDITLRRRGQAFVRVVDEDGGAVRTLTSGTHDRGPLRLTWDGRRQSGRPVLSGAYAVEVTVDAVTTRHPFLWSK